MHTKRKNFELPSLRHLRTDRINRIHRIFSRKDAKGQRPSGIANCELRIANCELRIANPSTAKSDEEDAPPTYTKWTTGGNLGLRKNIARRVRQLLASRNLAAFLMAWMRKSCTSPVILVLDEAVVHQVIDNHLRIVFRPRIYCF